MEFGIGVRNFVWPVTFKDFVTILKFVSINDKMCSGFLYHCIIKVLKLWTSISIYLNNVGFSLIV